MSEPTIEDARRSVAAPIPDITLPDGFGLPLDDMTAEQKLDEVLFQLRSVAAALKDFQGMGAAGIMKMLMGGKK